MEAFVVIGGSRNGRSKAAVAALLLACTWSSAGTAAAVFKGEAETSFQLIMLDGDRAAARTLWTTATDTRTAAVAGDGEPVRGNGPAAAGGAAADANAGPISPVEERVGGATPLLTIGDGLRQRATIHGTADGGEPVEVAAEAIARGTVAITNTSAEIPLELGFLYRSDLAGTFSTSPGGDGRTTLNVALASDLEGLVFADQLQLGDGTTVANGSGRQAGRFGFTIAPGSTLRLTAAALAVGEASVVPLPPALLMLASAVGGLAWLRRRAAVGRPPRRSVSRATSRSGWESPRG
jgi:hypothetical protein